MIERKELLAFNFYKKAKFTGSYQGMRYLIQKAVVDEKDIFQVFVWPGPYNFASTAENLKIKQEFPFSENALPEITTYLNRIYQEQQSNWHTTAGYE